jgi:hypothetical protein
MSESPRRQPIAFLQPEICSVKAIPETRLFQAIIVQAVVDLTSYHGRDRATAKIVLFSDLFPEIIEHRRMVFELAGWSATKDHILFKAKRLSDSYQAPAVTVNSNYQEVISPGQKEKQ